MSHTYDLNVLGSIPIDVEYSKVVVDLVNTVAFYSIILP